MTIAVLRRLLDEELPHVRRHPAPDIPHRHHRKETTTVQADHELPIDQLLAWADAHPDQDVQDQSARTRAGLAGLRARHTADTELTAITTEAEELEQRLAALRARETELRPAARKKTKAAAERDHDPAVVRAWAKQQGIECAPLGRVPRSVVDRWREAGEPQPLNIAS